MPPHLACYELFVLFFFYSPDQYCYLHLGVNCGYECRCGSVDGVWIVLGCLLVIWHHYYPLWTPKSHRKKVQELFSRTPLPVWFWGRTERQGNLWRHGKDSKLLTLVWLKPIACWDSIIPAHLMFAIRIAYIQTIVLYEDIFKLECVNAMSLSIDDLQVLPYFSLRYFPEVSQIRLLIFIYSKHILTDHGLVI